MYYIFSEVLKYDQNFVKSLGFQKFFISSRKMFENSKSLEFLKLLHFIICSQFKNVPIFKL